MKIITLVRKAVKRNEALTSYRLDLEVTGSQNISRDIFVKQRSKKFDGTIEDVFVAVASPATLEDYDAKAPSANSPFFRTNEISLVSSDPVFLDEAFDSILYEIRLLCDQAEVLEESLVDGIYTITSTEVNVNMAIVHTHYRVPLVAAPCGVNNVFIDDPDSLVDSDNIKKHEILSVDDNLPGWLPTISGDPAGYHWKYNLAKDSSLAIVWPVKALFLQYAHVEKNGVSVPDLLINADGIFWKSDLYGEVPWPKSYQNTSVPWVDPKDAVTLVFDTLA